jgi:hypothetical protein
MIPTESSSGLSNCSLELRRLLGRARLINQYYEKDFDLSFSSMLLAFLANRDPVSQWFRGYIKEAGIDVKRILNERHLTQQMIEDIASRTLLPELLQPPYRQTTSTTIYLSFADKFRESLAKGDATYQLNVHHLMAVYIYYPWVHERDLIRWGFKRVNWSSAFLNQMLSLYPNEFEFWKEQHLRNFRVEHGL